MQRNCDKVHGFQSGFCVCVHLNQSTDEKQYHRALCVTIAQVEPVLKTLFMGKSAFQKQL